MIIKTSIIDDFYLDKLVKIIIKQFKIDKKCKDLINHNSSAQIIMKNELIKEISELVELDDFKISEIFTKMKEYVNDNYPQLHVFHINGQDYHYNEFLMINDGSSHPDPVGPAGEPAVLTSKKRRKFHGDSKKTKKENYYHGKK